MILGFLLAICFNPYSYSAATNPRWALLALALPIAIWFRSPKHCTPLHLAGIVFLAWAVLSLTWTPNLLDGYNSTIQLLIVAVTFVLGARLPTLRPTFLGLALGLTLSSLILISPLKELHPIIEISHEGLLGNRNMLAEAAALTAIGCISYRLWWTIPGLLPAIIIPNARGALVGLGAGLLAWMWSRSRTWTLLLALLSICAVLISTMLRPLTVDMRLDMWTDTIKGLTLFGHGIGSFRYLFPFLTHSFDGASNVVDHPHNELLEIWFELGAVGLCLYAAMVAIAFRTADIASRSVMAGFIAIGCFAFPSHEPVTAFIGALVLGHAARNGLPIRSLFEPVRLALRTRLQSHIASEGQG